MVEWSIEAFRACGSVRSIVVAAPPGHVHDLAGSDLGVVPGGATRADSVANGLAAVGTALVAIHDAARPLLTPALVEALVAELDAEPEAAGAIAAAPVTDTIKRAARGKDFGPYGGPNPCIAVEETLDRSELWAAQTPQVFRTAALREALAAADEAARSVATDEASLVEASGGTVLIHPVETSNLKVTTSVDLRLAELLLGGS